MFTFHWDFQTTMINYFFLSLKQIGSIHVYTSLTDQIMLLDATSKIHYKNKWQNKEHTLGIPTCSPWTDGASARLEGINVSVTVVESCSSWPAKLSATVSLTFCVSV